MSLPYSAEGMGDVFGKMANLKHVGGKRKKILPGAEFVQDMEQGVPEVTGAGEPSPMNLPQADMGGELPSQAYDVRANQVIPLENTMQRFGTAMNQYINPQSEVTPETPPIETQQVDIQEGLPPVSASQEETRRGYGLQFLPNLYNPPKAAQEQVAAEEIQEAEEPINIPRGHGLAGLGMKPSLAPEFAEQFPEISGELKQKQGQKRIEKSQEETERFNREVEEAKANPGTKPVYGASDEIANSPELVAEFRNISGVDLDTPEIRNQISLMEALLTGQQEDLIRNQRVSEDQVARLEERIATNSTTENDKYFVGLALLMPLLIGGAFGAEAGLGALAGGAQAYGNILGNRQNAVSEDEKQLAAFNKDLANINTKKGELDIQRTQIPEQVIKSLPADEREFLKGRREYKWKDAVTGEEQTGVEILPDLISYPEFVTNKAAQDRMEKRADNLVEKKVFVQNITDRTDKAMDAISQLKDGNVFAKAFGKYLDGDTGALSLITQDINIDGERINAGLYLEQQFGFIANAYAQANSLGQLDRAAQAHIFRLMLNPTKSFASNKDVMSQMRNLRELTQTNYIREVSNNGFAPEFAMQEFRGKNKNINSHLNKKESVKESSSLIGELSGKQ
jgi:hypothetical protein